MGFPLAQDRVEAYRRDGYLFPLEVFSREQIDAINRELEQARDQARGQGLADSLDSLLRSNAQLLLPLVYRIARRPQLLDPVASILGPNLLLWSAEFFIKPANTDKIVSWHQDLTYWGLGETDDEITAWLALSPVNAESGCMRFVPGSHHRRILPHRDTFADANLLSRGQEVAVDIDENDAVDVVLRPGQLSLHHGRIFHASGSNRSDHDRVGLVFRFLTPQVRQQVASRDYAMQVRGIDDTDHWIHVAPPQDNFDPEYLHLRERIQQDQSVALAEGAAQELKTAE